MLEVSLLSDKYFKPQYLGVSKNRSDGEQKQQNALFYFYINFEFIAGCYKSPSFKIFNELHCMSKSAFNLEIRNFTIIAGTHFSQSVDYVYLICNLRQRCNICEICSTSKVDQLFWRSYCKNTKTAQAFTDVSKFMTALQ